MSGDMLPGTWPMVGTYQYHTILHETGHALGLKHGHSTDCGRNALPAEFDSMEFSVMTYCGFIGQSLEGGYRVQNGDDAQTLMMLDIQALQHICGADFSTRAGDTAYEWSTNGARRVDGNFQWRSPTSAIFLAIWDGGGNDSLTGGDGRDRITGSDGIDHSKRQGDAANSITLLKTDAASIGIGDFLV